MILKMDWKTKRAAARLKQRRGGWMLAESMVAIAIGITFLVAMTGVFISSSINFVDIGNYINMDRQGRNALDRMTSNIRNAKVLTSFDPAKLVFNYDSTGTTNLTYRYDSSTAVLTEEWKVGGSTTVKTLMTGCASLAFSLYNRDLAPTTDTSPGGGKVIGIAWNCTSTSLGRT